MNVATILAGGTGVRFGGEIPKQYTPVCGKPLLAYTLETFQSSTAIDFIQVVCRPEYNETVRSMAVKYGIDKLKWITGAGNNCPESIRNSVYALQDAMSGDDCFILHMGVSPLVTHDDIESAIALCREKGCSFTMHPVNICLARKCSDGWTDKDAPKENYIELNTPWAFMYSGILELYQELNRCSRTLGESDYTLTLWLASGRRAYYSPGSSIGRLKITTAQDMEMFEGYLLLKRIRQIQVESDRLGGIV